MSATVILLLMLGAPQDQGLREAARLDSEQRCQEAERYYRQALDRGSPSPALLNNLGNHYLVCGSPEEARKYFERLLKINPSHANANLQLARMETERKQGGKALEYLARVKETGPEIALLRAEASYYAGERAAAVSILDALQKGSSSDVRVLYAAGMTCARIGLYGRAEIAFNAALAMHPDDFDLLISLGRVAARAGHYDRAQRALEVAVKVRPSDADALLELGLVHAARQDYSRAVYLLAQARQLAPSRPDILLTLARAAEDAGYYGDSALAYDEYVQLRPVDDAARRDRARVYCLTGKRLEEGLKELVWYLQKHPGDAIGYFDLAQFSWSTEPQKALDQLSQALRLAPDFVPAQYARAWLLQRQGQIAESLPDLQAAVRLQPGNVRALDRLGLTYLSLDRPAQAEKTLRQALALAPEDPEVLLHLGRALMALDREAEARQFLDKFQKARPRATRDPRREAGMIELATLPSAERTRREIERLRQEARTHPSDPELQLSLAILLLTDGRTDEAAAEFRELLTRNADTPVWERAGKSLLAAGQYSLARDFLQRAAAPLDLAIAVFFTDGPQAALQAIAKVPAGEQAGDYLLMKARILDAAGQSAEAGDALREGIRLSVSRPEVARQAALLLLLHRQKAEALEMLRRAAEASPENADLLLAESIVMALMDRVSDAEKLLEQIESRWPEWDRAYLAHGLLLQRARPAEARQKLQTARALGSPETGAVCGLEQFLFPPCSR